MNTLWKYIQYGYLVIAIILFIEGFLNWNVNPKKSYLTFGLAIFAVLMFFFKRRFRKKIEERNKQR